MMSSTTATATTTPQPSQIPTSHLLIYNAHNGSTVKIPKPVRFHSIGAFKSFLYESFSDYLLGGVENIFLLTSFGIKFNFNMINELNDVYVYDKRLFSPSPSSSQILELYFHNNSDTNQQGTVAPKKPQPPSIRPITNSKSLQEMTENLKIIQTWSSQSVLSNCKELETQIKATVRQINIIFKCFNIIFHFGTNFISGIEKNFNSYFNYIKLTNMKTLHRSWQQYHRNLVKNFPLVTIGALTPGDSSKSVNIKLADLLDVNKLQLSLAYIASNLPKVVNKFNDMSSIINSVNEEKLDIDRVIEQLRNESINRFKDHEERTSHTNSKLSVLIRDIAEQLDDISNNSNTQNIELTYNNIVNGKQIEMLGYSNQLFDIYSELQLFRKKIGRESLNVFGGIANLQMRMVALKDELRSITEENGHAIKKNSANNIFHESPDNEISFEIINRIKKEEDYLSLTIDLPLLFGFMLIEKRRQYEWYDFYSKGVVKNISEQLSIMIEYEKVFRKLWIKKFGGFLSLLGAASDVAAIPGGGGLLYPKLPSIDVTLVNGEMEDDEFGNILKDILINRVDVLNYIDALKKYLIASATAAPTSKNFHTILEKNFQDLVKSTSNMKKVTKLVSSISTLTSPNSDEINNSKLDNQLMAISQHGKKLGNGGVAKEKSVDLDNDLNVIKGLKSRINKLENLLHQQQYKNLSQWPVTRGMSGNNATENGNMGNGSNMGKLSLIVDRKDFSSSRTNPTVFLQKTTPTPPSPIGENGSGRTVLDASTTIDKHLDNIRLRKENNEISQEIKRLHADNQSKDEIIRKLQNEINSLREKEREANEKVVEVTLREISFQKSQREKDEKISSLQTEIGKYLTMNNDKFEEAMKLNKIIDSTREDLKEFRLKYESLREEVKDSNDMKNDLLSNMSAKESEFAKERSTLEEEIKALKGKLEEVTDDYEDLMELTQSKQKHNEQLISELNFIGNQLVYKIKEVLSMSYNFYYDFCLVLESMGLLLVREFNEAKKIEELKIIRVKGLRSKSKDKEKDRTTTLLDDHEATAPAPQKPSSKVVESLSKLVTWVNEIQLDQPQESPALEGIENVDGNEEAEEIQSKDISIPDSPQNLQIIKTFKENFEGTNSKFNELFENLQYPPIGNIDLDSSMNTTSHTAFVAAISKRFRDVEGFAKKLTKENRSKMHEINKLSTKMANKISMNDFQIGDLVLFLPTRIDHMSEFEENFQLWAAFNFRSPHYFLKVYDDRESGKEEKFIHNLKDKDWMVGRIVDITSHLVSEDSGEENPFQLSDGVSWFYVEAKEVDLA